MIWSVSVLLFAGIPVQQSLEIHGHHFDNYHQAQQAARKTNKPLLMILADKVHSGESPVSLVKVRKSAERRKLLEDYVVVVIDTRVVTVRLFMVAFFTSSPSASAGR